MHKCGDCKRDVADDQHLTEVNPEGGYGRPQLLVCDDCMGSDKWSWWRSQYWPTWPEKGPTPQGEQVE